MLFRLKILVPLDTDRTLVAAVPLEEPDEPELPELPEDSVRPCIFNVFLTIRRAGTEGSVDDLGFVPRTGVRVLISVVCEGSIVAAAEGSCSRLVWDFVTTITQKVRSMNCKPKT